MTIFVLRTPTVAAIATSVSLTFSGTENPLSQGGKFDNGLAVGLDWNNFKVVNGIACAGGISADPAPPFNDSIAILKASAFACPNDQYAEQTIRFLPGYVPPGTHEHGLFVRATLTAHSMTGYEWYIGAGGASTIVRWNGPLNDFTPIINITPAATNNKTEAKGSAGQLYFVNAVNLNAAVRYLKIFNKTSANVTAGTTAADYQFAIPGNTAGAGVTFNIDKGIAHSNGITFMITTGVALIDNTATAANEQIVTIGYK